MAQFYAEIQGNRGEATRMGTKTSGIRGHIRGWYVGIEVRCEHLNGEDVCIVYKTGGSSRSWETEKIGEFKASGNDIYTRS